MSRISAAQNASIDKIAPNPADDDAAHLLGSTVSSNTSQATGDDTNSQISSPLMNIFSPPNSNTAVGGQTMVRVKSLPESKDEWAALQKRKEMDGSPGVAGAISMGTPAAVGVVTGLGTGVGIGGGIGGIGATGAAATGMLTGTGIEMMGEYSKEHMGREGYYYRNWFLGRGTIYSIYFCR